MLNDLIIETSQTVSKLIEDFDALDTFEKGQVSDQLAVELSIVMDFCEAAKIRIEKFMDSQSKIREDTNNDKCPQWEGIKEL